MKACKYWIVPGLFFLVASILNITGKLWNPVLAETVKPALMPLLALTAVVAAGGIQNKEIRILVPALLLGCVGDTFLIFDGFLPFVFGMVAFLAGHIFYMCLFGGKSWKGFTWKTWIPAIVAMAALTAVLIVLIGVNGAMLVPMCVYGFALMMLIFSALAGVARFGGCAWWTILCGAVLFTFSDACIALGTFGHDFAGRNVVIMVTYLAAQSLLAAGTIKLAKNA
ncbi:MAG: lysoplasmalogenase [Bacteroidales bacterium]|nr:lysoplasmalogenase [Bacteroidales bacterium]